MLIALILLQWLMSMEPTCFQRGGKGRDGGGGWGGGNRGGGRRCDEQRAQKTRQPAGMPKTVSLENNPQIPTLLILRIHTAATATTKPEKAQQFNTKEAAASRTGPPRPQTSPPPRFPSTIKTTLPSLLSLHQPQSRRPSTVLLFLLHPLPLYAPTSSV